MSIPVFLFSEHNQAFYYWQLARYKGILKKRLDLFHIDAHADMGTVFQTEKSLYFPKNSKAREPEYYKDLSENNLKNNEFIIPAVLTGIIKNIYYIYPAWRKLSNKKLKKNVASAFGEGKVLKYDLKLNRSNQERILQAFPDLKSYNYSRLCISDIPGNKDVLLDIDLDYFACRDSILNYMNYSIEITEAQYKNRAEFFRTNPSLKHSTLELSFKKSRQRYYVNISFKKGEEVAYLPEKSEIIKRIDEDIQILVEKRIKTLVITVCRSDISGYCPVEYSRFIEQELIKKLKQVFNIKIFSTI